MSESHDTVFNRDDVNERRRIIGPGPSAHILGGVLAGIEGQLERIADAAEYQAVRTMTPQTTEAINKQDELRRRLVGKGD